MISLTQALSVHQSRLSQAGGLSRNHALGGEMCRRAEINRTIEVLLEDRVKATGHALINLQSPCFLLVNICLKKEELGVRDLNFLISHHQNIHIISRKKAKFMEILKITTHPNLKVITFCFHFSVYELCMMKGTYFVSFHFGPSYAI